MHASRKHTKKPQIPGSKSSSLKSLLRSVLRLNFMQRELSLADRRSIRRMLISILNDASEIAELRTMWEKGTLPTTISTEYAELLSRFNEKENG